MKLHPARIFPNGGFYVRLNNCKNPGNTIRTSGIWTISPEMMAIASVCSLSEPESRPNANANANGSNIFY